MPLLGGGLLTGKNVGAALKLVRQSGYEVCSALKCLKALLAALEELAAMIFGLDGV